MISVKYANNIRVSQREINKISRYIWAYFKIVFSLRRDIFHDFLTINNFPFGIICRTIIKNNLKDNITKDDMSNKFF